MLPPFCRCKTNTPPPERTNVPTIDDGSGSLERTRTATPGSSRCEAAVCELPIANIIARAMRKDFNGYTPHCGFTSESAAPRCCKGRPVSSDLHCSRCYLRTILPKGSVSLTSATLFGAILST